MNWFGYALGAAVFNSLARTLVRVASKGESDSQAYIMLHNLIAAAVGFPLMLPILLHYPTDVKIWGLAFLAFFFYAIGDWAPVRALKEMEASVFLTIVKLRAVITLVGGAILYSEAITIGKVGGICLILIGSYFVMLQGKKLTFPKGTIYAIISVFAISAGFLIDKTIVNHFPIPMYMFLAFFVSSGIIGIPMKNRKERLIKEFRQQKWKVVIPGVLFALFYLCLLYGYESGEVSKVTAVFESGVIMSVFISVTFLKERKNLLGKIIGSIIVFGGMMLIKLM